MDTQETGSNRPIVTADVVDLRYLFIVWLKWSWITIPLVALGAYFGYRSLQDFVPVYEAKLIVQPAGGGQAAQVAQISSILSALGSGGGGGGDAGPFERLKLLVGSRTLASRLQEKHQLMQDVFAESWDEKSQSWRTPSGPAFERQERIRKILKQKPWSPPSLDSLAGYLDGLIKFENDPANPFVEVIATHIDREQARKLLELVYFEADDLLRNQDRTESEKRRAYVEEKLRTVQSIDGREALISLLTTEERKAMLLDSDIAYAAKIIEPTFTSEAPTSPNTHLIFGIPIALTVFGGFALLTLIALFRRESGLQRAA